MLDQDRELYRVAYDCFEKLTTLIEDRRIQIEKGEMSLEETTDAVFAVKKSAEMLHQLVKTMNGVKETGDKLICLRWMTSNLNGKPIRTEHTTASPTVTPMPVLPTGRKQPEDYAAFCKHFGISEDLIKNDAFRPHWPGMKQQIQDDAENGRPLPPGCDPSKTYQVFNVVYRSKKGVLEQD